MVHLDNPAPVRYVLCVFTGLVEAVGKLESRAARGPGARLSIATSLRGLALGESVAVGGVCLTVDAVTRTGFEADASAETLEKTTLGALAVGGRVNLERALTLEKRLGGNIVTGHVDGVGELVSRTPLGEAERLTFRFPSELGRFIAPKGSISVDGISLTVNGVRIDGTADTFDVAIIPRTKKETTLGDLAVGGAVNLEVDVLARYVLRMLDSHDAALEPHAGAERDAALAELLRKNGYM